MSRRRRNSTKPKLIDPDPIEAVTATINVTDAGSNLVETSTVYVNASEVDNDWVVDALIESSEQFPIGTLIEITSPNIGGVAYELTTAKNAIWLSDLIFFQNASAPRRTKLNTHTTQVFNFTVIPPTGTITTDLTFKVFASDSVAEGSRHGIAPMVSPTLLGEATQEDITFEE